MTARTKTVVINLSALITAVIGAAAWSTPRLGAFVDQRYVHADSFRLLRFRDSMTHAAEIKDIHRFLYGLDSAIRRRPR